MVRSILPWVAVAAAVGHAMGKGCAVFDSNMNLYVLAPGADYTLGAQSTWSGASAQAFATTGARPPFDGDRPRCHLAQSMNAVFAFGADQSNPTAVWILDVAAKSWSMQAMGTSDAPDPANMWEVMDHDTNVVYAYSKGTMFFARFDGVKAATSSPNDWVNQGVSFPFPADNYKATVANANNRVHFFGTEGAQPGQSYLFVIHFAYPQPAVQAYPSTTSQATFPASHGWAASIYSAENKEQRQMAFIPDDLSATYIVDSKVNQTLPMAAPTVKDSGSYFAGSTSAVVQLTSDGKLFYLPVAQDDIAGTAGNRGAGWKALATVPVGGSGGGASGTQTATGSGSTPTKVVGSSNNAKPSNTSSDNSGNTPDDAAGHLASVSWLASLVAIGAYML